MRKPALKMTLGIQFKLILLVASLLFFVCVSLGLISYWQSSQALINNNYAALEAKVADAGKLVFNKIEGDKKLLEGVAQNPVVRSMDWSQLEELLQAESERLGYSGMGIADRDGILRMNDGNISNISDFSGFQKALAGKTDFSDPIMSDHTSTVVIMETVPVFNEDRKIIGVLFAELNATHLNSIVSNIKIGKNGYAFMLNQEGTTIAHRDINKVLKQENLIKDGKDAELSQLIELEKKMIKDEVGTGEYSYQGSEKFMAYRPVSGTNWSVAVTVPKKEIMEGVNALYYFIFVVTAVLLLISIAISALIGRSIAKPINLVANLAEIVSKGNFSNDIPKKLLARKDEIGHLAQSFDKINSNLSGFVNEIANNAESLAATAEQLSASTQQISAGTQEQSGQLQLVTLSVKDLSEVNNKVTSSANNAAIVADKVKNTADEGAVLVLNVDQGMKTITDNMHKLDKNSQKIGEIITVIEDIADQTNLLALNAAIEAARAGDYGRGFAVVAGEVRKLAERSGSATKEIAQVIEMIEKDTRHAVVAVEQGAEMMGGAKNSFSMISDLSKENAQTVYDIVNVANQADNNTNEVSTATENISAVVEEAAAGVQEISASAEEMAAMAERLLGMLREFKVKE